MRKLKTISNKTGVRIIKPESDGCYPFSLMLLFDDASKRERVKKRLIEKRVYPAILWDIPKSREKEVLKVSRGVLSIHCDGRYSTHDIMQLKTIIESVLE